MDLSTKSVKQSTARTPSGRSIRDKLTLGASVFVGSLLFLWILSLVKGSGPGVPPPGSPPTLITKAVAVLSGSFNVTGTVTFQQDSRSAPVIVRGELQNLASRALRGFHVHEFGDLTTGCLSAGAHFNPFGKDHGAPSDKERHVGDLGNVEANEHGVATFMFEDPQLSLNGPLSIIGRAVVIHNGTDDLGQGGDEESRKTGNAGARAACGVIGVSA